MGSYCPQESLYKPYKYHGYTVRGTPNCPLIHHSTGKEHRGHYLSLHKQSEIQKLDCISIVAWHSKWYIEKINLVGGFNPFEKY